MPDLLRGSYVDGDLLRGFNFEPFAGKIDDSTWVENLGPKSETAPTVHLFTTQNLQVFTSPALGTSLSRSKMSPIDTVDGHTVGIPSGGHTVEWVQQSEKPKRI